MILRRLRSIPLVLLAFAIVTAVLPVLLLIAAGIDLFRVIARHHRPTALRLALMLWCWLAGEAVGLVVLAVIWVASGLGRRSPKLTGWTWRTQQAWAGWMFGSARLLFDLRLSVEGEGAAAAGPFLLFVRHTSILDNLLPSLVVSRPLGIRLRYVLKRELLVDPCFDVAGTRLPNHFVRRDSGDPREIEAVKDLARGLGSDDAVLIYPEGTRATPERRERALERIAKRDPDRARRLSGLKRCLPPRQGGPMALLDAAPDIDVVLFMHAGLDGLRRVRDVWRGELVRRPIRVRLERVPRRVIPGGAAAAGWLDSTWEDIDRWVDASLSQMGIEA